jgi:signal transduction histidine kinase
MKKVALVFVVAVLVPSLVLAWLAVRSLRDQQFLLERQQSLLYQRVTDALAQSLSDHLARQQQEFSAQVESLVSTNNPSVAAVQFDNQLRKSWPLAAVGFCVTLSGNIACPSPAASAEAQQFLLDNSGFLANKASAEVYWNANNGKANTISNVRNIDNQSSSLNLFSGSQPGQQLQPAPAQAGQLNASNMAQGQNYYGSKGQQVRSVNPLKVNSQTPAAQNEQGDNNFSKVIPAEAEFRQLIGDETDGMLARFLQNKLKLMFWHRLNLHPDFIFGAQLNLNRVVAGLRDLVQADPELRESIAVVLLDDNAKPVVISRNGFQANWKRPFVATEIGDTLPHWEVAAYFVNPAQLTQAARTASLTLGLLVAVLLVAIGVGSWLIVRSLGAELKLARQKTDFVSNVSHELKTPLTSIRMFSELLAEGRVTDESKQRSYLNIISAEAARLTRLINNVLDFSRMEQGEKEYHFQACDLVDIVCSAAETFRPHLESAGFKFDCELPSAPVLVRGDPDALSQILLNLLSNAEKYSNGGREIMAQLAQKQSPLPHAEIRVLDRGAGVPRGCEEKIFEKFYRAHDSLGSGVQGSGLGLTIARQIARAHGGDVVYEPRDGGGSCFILRLPISTTDKHG